MKFQEKIQRKLIFACDDRWKKIKEKSDIFKRRNKSSNFRSKFITIIKNVFYPLC